MARRARRVRARSRPARGAAGGCRAPGRAPAAMIDPVGLRLLLCRSSVPPGARCVGLSAFKNPLTRPEVRGYLPGRTSLARGLLRRRLGASLPRAPPLDYAPATAVG